MIHDTNELMDFEKNITFISPKSVSSGSYLIKCFDVNQTPLFLQSPKCKSKLGFQKAGKKLYCDLVFTYEDESFLKWVEDLETFCQKKIFENRSTWFDSELEMHDIENSFLPSLKIFKSGKQHILRANIPIRLGKCSLKIYNENEDDVKPEDIVENSNLMTILEIQGIKCSSRSFQIEYEVKQMMLLNPIDIFEKCVFPVKNKIQNSDENKHLGNSLVEKKEDPDPILETIIDSDPILEPEPILEKDLAEIDTIENIKIVEEEKGDICEIDLEITDKTEDVLQLKNRNAVYFEMYREAKKKARMARDFALSAYLEAKRIKNTYLFDEAFDSDDEKDLEEKSLENIL
jgi:hypothetical protein